jgi:hypothetical protein
MSEFDSLVVASENSGAIATWSDDKKKDYVALFNKRANAEIYIFRRISYEIARRANEKHFLGTPRFRELGEEIGRSNWGQQYYSGDLVAGTERSVQDLEIIVNNRVTELLKMLPSINKAMEVLDPETATKMIRRDALETEAQDLVDELNELSEDISLADIDQNMTIGQFRAHVKSIEEKRKALIEQIEAKGKEGQELERQINKTLYRGMPGISDEICEVSKKYFEKATALDQMKRRVEEQVRFGDNDAALQMLKIFEKDEITLKGDVAVQFQNSLEKLRLAVAKSRKRKSATKE